MTTKPNCPKCDRRRIRGPDPDGKYKCRKCRHIWKPSSADDEKEK